MSWKDRLKEPAITTPDGERYIFEYGDVEKELNKKTSTYIFGDTPKAKVDDFGLGAVNVPLTIFFSGTDYDEIANQFEISAGLAGLSVLEHPVYGILNVVITSIKRRDAVKSAGGQAIFTLGITETIAETVPVAAEQTRSAILAQMSDYEDINAEAFADGYDTSFISDAISAAGRVTAFVDDLKSNFNDILDTVQSVQDAFNDIEDFINSNIDFLLGAPLLLANSVQRLIDTPARISASVSSRVDAYLNSYNNLTNPVSASGTADALNQRLERQLLTTSIISSISKVNLFPDDGTISEPGAADIFTGFLTKSDAIESASELITQLTDNQEFLDTEEQNSLSDSLEKRFAVSDSVTKSIKDIVSSTAKNLIRLSFSLKQERIITLEKPRDIITLSRELYGTSNNDTREFLVETNQLTGRELIDIPIGREIKYYV